VPSDSSTRSRQQAQPLPTEGHRCNSRKITQCKAKFLPGRLQTTPSGKPSWQQPAHGSRPVRLGPRTASQSHKNTERYRYKARLLWTCSEV